MNEYPPIDTEQSMACEAKVSWGGAWTEEKLDAFAKYVNAYLTIMNNYRDKYGWKLIYFDGFAGSGTRGEESSTDSSLESLFEDSDFGIEPSELDVYIGAAERVVQLSSRGFDYYYFNEKDQESCASLQDKLSAYDNGSARFVYRSNDANEEVRKLAEALKKDKSLKALVLLDPFGMQLDWESISSLNDCGADVWILVPTGVIINRLLDKKGKLIFSNKLQKFFGLSESQIKDFFYKTETQTTLFGEEEVCLKIPNAIPKIAELYVSRLKEIFKYVTEKPLVLYNSQHTPIFHFVFGSNNETARKIASEIVGKKNTTK